MNAIKIGPKYFQNEKRAYQCHVSATMREFLQNSNDVEGCTRIDITVTPGENTDTITVRDNGKGMSREIFDTVFMVLGESTKGSDSGVCGGMGIARNLIIFAQHSYIIRSHDWIATGCGANYEVEQTKEFVRGCEFTIQADKADWIEKLKQILSVSSIDKTIYINGEKWQNVAHRARFVRDLSFGKVYVNKSGSPMLIVRSNGLFMFAKHVSVKAAIFVELNDAKSHLTSNRDGLKYQASCELDAFLQELATETMSALKPKKPLFRKLLKSGIGFAARIKRAVSNEIEQIKQVANDKANGVTVSAYAMAEPQRMADGEYEAREFKRSDFEAPVAHRNPLLESCYVVCESYDLETTAKKFDPELMDENSTRYKLLATWHKMVEIIANMHVSTVGEFVYGVGFIFSEDTEAQYRYENGVHYFLLNPINIQTKKIKFSVNDKSDLGELVSLAAHEVTHLDCPAHNETFSSRYTDLMKKVLGDYSNVLRQVKEVK